MERNYDNRYEPDIYYSYDFKVYQNGQRINTSRLDLDGIEENNTSYAEIDNNQENNQENDSDDEEDEYDEKFNPKYWSTILNLILDEKIYEEEENWVELMQM